MGAVLRTLSREESHWLTNNKILTTAHAFSIERTRGQPVLNLYLFRFGMRRSVSSDDSLLLWQCGALSPKVELGGEFGAGETKRFKQLRRRRTLGGRKGAQKTASGTKISILILFARWSQSGKCNLLKSP